MIDRIGSILTARRLAKEYGAGAALVHAVKGVDELPQGETA
jgi:hypothetical protein